MNYIILFLGLALIVLVMARLLISIGQSVRRLNFSSQVDQLSLELFQQRVATAKKESVKTTSGWNGYRKFEIVRKELESNDTYSFYLKPHDGKSIAEYRPGQYLTFRLSIPGREKPVFRCYSISDYCLGNQYRVTIKKALPPASDPMLPAGLVSSYFHEQLESGDLVDVQAPCGNFVIDPTEIRPAVLIAGGIGITPILSMAKSIVAVDSGREFYMFYGVGRGSEHTFKTELEELDQNPNCRIVVCYSEPAVNDLLVEGQQYQHHGWLSVELMRSYLDSTNYEFFICGPPAMMKSLTDQLLSWGVAPGNIFREAFGAATIKEVAESTASKPAETGTQAAKITFDKSGIETNWNSDLENLLNVAEEHGVVIQSGCRAGNCGTCTIAIKSGTVRYQVDPGVCPEQGSCLPCIAIPTSDLILDA